MQLFFLIIITLSLIAIVSIFFMNYRALKKGEVEVKDNWDNYKTFAEYCLAFYKYILRRINRGIKFATQYSLHLIVRFFYIINVSTDKVYAFSRNLFVKRATKNKSTVTHFWNHLKVYKREIDEEKE